MVLESLLVWLCGKRGHRNTYVREYEYSSDVGCFCHLYPDYVHPTVQHVVTGDVNIVMNKALRKTFKKGFGYIEPIYKDKLLIFNSIKSDLKTYVNKLANKHSITHHYFDEWLARIVDKVKSKVFSSKIVCKRNTSVFSTESNDFNTLKEHFIMTSVDKAGNNISFFCKQYYLKNLENELSTTQTYQRANESEEDIVRKHVQFCTKFNIPVGDMSLPFMHVLPKFHKPQLDFRYIAAGTRCSTKKISKILSGILKLCDKTLKHDDDFKFKFKYTTGYWVTKSNDSTIYNLNYLNNVSSAKSVDSFDFKKLYTNIPHDKVIDKISDLIKRCFMIKKVDFIKIDDKFNACWKGVKKTQWTYTCQEVLEMFSFLINNIYVKFKGIVYKQIVGIPMGCDCAPQVADLFLYWYEHSYILKAIADKNPVIHTLKYARRYIDDLNIPNASRKLCDIITKEIYPEDLSIVATNDSKLNTTFLDLDIRVDNNMFICKLYDKRRDFPFKVVTFPNLKSNVPNGGSYGTFVGELYRISKSSSDHRDFIVDVRQLVVKLINQNFERNKLYGTLNNFLKSRPGCLSKYWHNFNVSEFM